MTTKVRLTTEAHRPAWQIMADAMAAASRREGWRERETLARALEAGFLAWRGVFLAGDAREANEARYMRIVEACRARQETMGDLTRIVASVGVALAAEPVDFLGPIFSEFLADDGMGQFFTPWQLASAIARMTVSAGDFADKPWLSLLEPACGAGGIILATNAALRDAGVDVERQARWHAIDVDARAVHACYLQLVYTDCWAVVVRGNALAPTEADEASLTPAAALYRAPPAGSPPSAPPSVGEQMTLF